MKFKNLHTLIIGPRLNLEKSNLGGATVSFECLIQYYQDHKIPHKIIDTQYASGVSRIFHFFSRFFYYIWRADIVFLNSSRSGLKNFSPFIYILSKLLGKKVVIRPFGRSLKSVYDQSGSLVKWLLRKTTLQADILYLQTKRLIIFFQPLSKNILHLKTSRYLTESDLKTKSVTFSRRFVFLGHIKKTKGVMELIAAARELDGRYTVDMYGPIKEEEMRFVENEQVYKGELKGPEAVMKMLGNYDVVVLPTYYEGEGYPGVIVEAYSLGLPVISTHWNAIPEIVEENETGFLIEPESVSQLVAAMMAFTEDNYQQMSKNALSYYFRNFQIREVMSSVMKELDVLIHSN